MIVWWVIFWSVYISVYRDANEGSRNFAQEIFFISSSVYHCIVCSSYSSQINKNKWARSAFAFCSGVRTDVFISNKCCNQTSLLIPSASCISSSTTTRVFFLVIHHHHHTMAMMKRQTILHQPNIIGHVGSQSGYTLAVGVSSIMTQKK